MPKIMPDSTKLAAKTPVTYIMLCAGVMSFILASPVIRGVLGNVSTPLIVSRASIVAA